MFLRIDHKRTEFDSKRNEFKYTYSIATSEECKDVSVKLPADALNNFNGFLAVIQYNPEMLDSYYEWLRQELGYDVARQRELDLAYVSKFFPDLAVHWSIKEKEITKESDYYKQIPKQMILNEIDHFLCRAVYFVTFVYSFVLHLVFKKKCDQCYLYSDKDKYNLKHYQQKFSITEEIVRLYMPTDL